MEKNTASRPRLIIADARRLDEAKAMLANGSPALQPAFAALREAVAGALKTAPVSVTEKKEPPPGGVRNDYISMAPYWWPDPAAADGRPYIRRDGEVNPEAAGFDRQRLHVVANAVETLALGWFFFADPACVDHAAKMLRVFFLDAATRMNPHLEFGQFIPGRCAGRGIGIIETTAFATVLVDALGLLAGARSFPPAVTAGMKNWFADYLHWLQTSGHGRDEQRQKNNHGTACDLQVAVFALFTGRDELARDTLRAVPGQRLAPQIEPDGRQPLELARTKSLHYSSANLGLFFSLAETAAGVGLDLWSYETADGRGIRRALDWLVPFWTGERPWAYQQIVPFTRERACCLLRRAARAYREPAYETARARVARAGKPLAGPPPDTIDGDGAGQMPLADTDPARLRCNLYHPPAAENGV